MSYWITGWFHSPRSGCSSSKSSSTAAAKVHVKDRVEFNAFDGFVPLDIGSSVTSGRHLIVWLLIYSFVACPLVIHAWSPPLSSVAVFTDHGHVAPRSRCSL